jgi:hypothetical protein
MQTKNKTTHFVSFIQSYIEKVIDKINTAPAFVVLCVLFSGNFLTFIPDGNEENYLELSKQFLDPDWIYHSFSLTEFAGTRLLYQYICGFVLQYASFEIVTFFGRLLIILWYAAMLASLVKKFKILNIHSLFLFQVVFFIQQFTFGGENFFLGFESKHISYGFVLLALNAYVDKKYFRTVLFIACASWFHILLGGWLFLACMIDQLFNKEISFRKLLVHGLVYAVLLLPFVWYLVSEIVLHTSAVKGALSADWIYCYYRNPHHTAIFYSIEYFYDHHAAGVLWVLIIGLVTAFVYPSIVRPELIHVNKFVYILSCILLINVLLAFFDGGGHFVKYYPFRLASVHLFLFYLISFSILIQYFSAQKQIQSMFVIAVVLFFGMAVLLNIYKMMRFMKRSTLPFYQMTAYIKQHTPKDAVVYYSDKAEDHTLSFIRESGRDRFVVYKFVPAGTGKIYEWYDRMLIQEKADKNPLQLIEAKKKYKIDYVLTTDSIVSEKFDLVKSISPYLLYEFR